MDAISLVVAQERQLTAEMGQLYEEVSQLGYSVGYARLLAKQLQPVWEERRQLLVRKLQDIAPPADEEAREILSMATTALSEDDLQQLGHSWQSLTQLAERKGLPVPSLATPTPVPSFIRVPAKTPSPTPVQTATAGMTRYVDPTLTYSISLPAAWQVSWNPGGFAAHPKPETGIRHEAEVILQIMPLLRVFSASEFAEYILSSWREDSPSMQVSPGEQVAISEAANSDRRHPGYTAAYTRDQGNTVVEGIMLLAPTPCPAGGYILGSESPQGLLERHQSTIEAIMASFAFQNPCGD